MYNHSGGLADDDDRIVLIQNIKRYLFGRDGGFFRRRNDYLNNILPMKEVVRFNDCAIHSCKTVINQLLRLTAGQILNVAGGINIEPFACFLTGYGKLIFFLQKLIYIVFSII